jgi:hypothetical protein
MFNGLQITIVDLTASKTRRLVIDNLTAWNNRWRPGN